MFAVINQLMKSTGPEYRGAQVNAIKNFGYIMDDLGKIFVDAKELSNIVVDFVNSIHYDPSLKLINLEKVAMIGKLLGTNFFKQEGSRASTISDEC